MRQSVVTAHRTMRAIKIFFYCCFIAFAESENVNVRQFQHGAIFRKVGDLYPSLSYGHINIKLNLDDLIRRRTGLTRTNTNFKEQIYPDHFTTNQKRRMDYLKDMVNNTVQHSITKLNATLRAFDLEDAEVIKTKDKNKTEDEIPNKREKRQIIVGALGAITGSLVTSIISNFKKETLIHIIEKRQNLLIHEVEAQSIKLAQHQHDLKYMKQAVQRLTTNYKNVFWAGKSLKTEELGLFVTYTLLTTVDNLNSIIKGINSAQAGLFTLDMVTPEGLETAIKALQEKCAAEGKQLSIQSIFDLPHLPLSYVFDPNTHILNVILHVPLSYGRSSMPIYEYIDFPLRTNGDMYITFEPRNKYIIVNPQGTTYLERSTLEDCHKLHDAYFCNDDLIYKKSRVGCLSALYGHDNNISKLCDSSLTYVESKAERINDTSYLLLETKPTELTLTCNDQLKLKMRIQGSYIVNLDLNCMAITDHIIIQRPKDEPAVSVEGFFSNTDFLNYSSLMILDDDEIDLISSEFLSKVGEKIPLSQVKSLLTFQKKLKQIEKEKNFDFSKFAITPGAIFSSFIPFGTIATLVILFFVSRYIFGACNICKRNDTSKIGLSISMKSLSRKGRRNRGKSASDSETSGTLVGNDTLVEDHPQGAIGGTRPKLPIVATTTKV